MNRSAYLRNIAKSYSLVPNHLLIDGPATGGMGARNKYSTRVKYKMVFGPESVENARLFAEQLKTRFCDIDIEDAYVLDRKRTYGFGDHVSVIVWFSSRNRRKSK
jgi:hypothetical protein